MHSNHVIREIFILLNAYGDFILFPLVVLEGPVVTVIAGFLSSVGVFSLIPTFLTIVVADLTGDVFYYSLGRWWLTSALTKLTNLFKVNPKIIDKLEGDLRTNKGKVLFLGKLSHIFGVPILMAAGHAKIPLPEFIWYNFLATVPKSLIFIMVGYLLGSTINNYNKYVNLTILGIFALTLLIIAVNYFVKRFSKNLLRKI